MRIFLIGCCVLLASCGTYEWQHKSLGPAQADAQLLKCEEKALKLYPTLVTQDVSGGKSKTAASNCAGVKEGSKAAIACSQGGSKSYGASTYSRDINRSDRERATRRCMGAEGWRRVKVD
jgi:hypothetical protein